MKKTTTRTSVSTSTVSRSSQVIEQALALERVLEMDRKCEDLLHDYLVKTLPAMDSSIRLDIANADFHEWMDAYLAGEDPGPWLGDDIPFEDSLAKIKKSAEADKHKMTELPRTPLAPYDNKYITDDCECLTCHEKQLVDVKWERSYFDDRYKFIFTFDDGTYDGMIVDPKSPLGYEPLNRYMRDHNSDISDFLPTDTRFNMNHRNSSR